MGPLVTSRMVIAAVVDQERQHNPSELSRESDNEEDPLIEEIRQRESQPTTQIDRSAGTAKRLAERFPTTCGLMSSGRLVAAMYGGFVQVALICSFDSILPIFVHKTFSWDSSATGLSFLAISIPALTGPLIGLLSDRLGTRIVVLRGVHPFDAGASTLELGGRRQPSTENSSWHIARSNR